MTTPQLIEKLDQILLKISIIQKTPIYGAQDYISIEEREESHYQYRINSVYYHALVNRADHYARVILETSRTEFYQHFPPSTKGKDHIKSLLDKNVPR